MLPARSPSLLPENFAAYSKNAWLYHGDLRGFRKPKQLHTLASNLTRTVYRIPDATKPMRSFDNSTWIEFQDQFTDVIRAPTINDAFRRYYYFSPSVAPSYNTFARIQASDSPFLLGVPAPPTAPTVNITGSANTLLVTRAYVYTWQTAYGEEGPPSPPVVVTSDITNTWQVVVTAPLSGVTTGRNIEKVNIYRTIANGEGGSTFFRVASLPIATLTHVDSALDTVVSGNPQLQSTLWTPPPATLQGCVSLPNGILAGWANSTDIYFCEPYRPHAWPVSYAVSVDYPIVGLGVTGQSLVVMTEGSPYMMTGVHPSAMSLSAIKMREPCVSRRSIVSTEEGVFYASQNGLMLIQAGYGVGRNATVPLFSRQDWNALSPELFMGARANTAYVGFVRNGVLTGGRVYDGSVNDGEIIDGSTGGEIIDGLREQFVAFADQGDNGFIIENFSENTSFTRLAFDGVLGNVVQDEPTGEVLLVSGDKVFQWDSPAEPILAPYRWVSKEYSFPYKQQFIAAKVHFDLPPGLAIPTPAPETRNTDQAQTFNPATQYLILKVYADGNLILVREVQKSGELIKLPSGSRYEMWQFELVGQVIVTSLQLAPSVKELREG
jgi:hypothetical protein